LSRANDPNYENPMKLGCFTDFCSEPFYQYATGLLPGCPVDGRGHSVGTAGPWGVAEASLMAYARFGGWLDVGRNWTR